MTTEELKAKILEKCESILNDNPSAADLVKLAKVYSELTQRDWVEAIYKSTTTFPIWNNCCCDSGEITENSK